MIPGHVGAQRRTRRYLDLEVTVKVMTAVVVLAFGALFVPVVVPGMGSAPVIAQSDDDAAQRAAAEIRAARDRANAAADAFFQAQSDLEQLEDDVVRLEAEQEQIEGDIDRLRGEVESVAINRFMSSGSAGIPLFTNVQRPQDQVQASVFVDVLRNSSIDTLDEFDAARDELARNQAELAERRAEIENAQVVFTAMRERAEDEVERLREIEEERLANEAVRKALEAQAAAERARLEEEARREAEAAARSVPDIAAGATLPAAGDGAGAADDGAGGYDDGAGADGGDVAQDGGDGGDGAGAADDDGADDTADTTPPVSTVPQNSGSAGGESGGRTGTGGGGNSPRGVTSGGVYIDAITCPILGSAYGDTWGAPRSGGRRHQGVDMIAPPGAPLYAVTDGVVQFKQNRLGGNAVTLLGGNGNRYYYAHLSSYEGASGRRVAAGEVIGYNGATGNASVAHLHFELRPGGGVTVNPYPSVRAAGC